MTYKSEYRKALGSFATGVTIITTQHEGNLFGFTANSFTSVSLDPPLVLFCIKKNRTFLEGLDNSKVFGINFLSSNQEGLSNKFANPALLNDQRFDGVKTSKSALNCPILKGCIAFLDCEQIKVLKAGDHLIIIGEVKNFDRFSENQPLVYFRGGYETLE